MVRMDGFQRAAHPVHNPPAALKTSPDYPVDANNEITGAANRRPAYEAAPASARQ